MEMLKQLAAGIAAQFGSNCEVVIHDVSSNHPDHSIVHIENGHVSGRKVGDGASQVVLDQMASQAEHPRDHLCYLTRTPDGKILKSSTLYIRNRRGAVTAIFSINYDVSGLMMIQSTIGDLLSTQDKEQTEPERIINVNHVLDELIEQAFQRIGKPAAVMTKDDKIDFIRLLNDAGAFLITKSGQRVCQVLCISKFTLYSYLNEIKAEDEETKAEQD